MWMIGLGLGLLVGAMFESSAAALLFGIVGAVAFHKWVRLPAKQAGGVPDAPLVTALQQRIAALEQRVQALELNTGTLATPVDPMAPLPADAPTLEPTESMPPTVVAAPIAASPVSHDALPALEAPAMARVEVDASDAETASAFETPEAPEPPPPRQPPAPRIPLRDRLPAPVVQLIFGGNMLVKLGVLILFLGLAFLLRYTAERVTVPIELRYASVALIGAALLALGWVLRHRRAAYALTLQGAGIGVFYLTTLAAMKLSALLPPEIGFAFLFAVAVLAALLAILQNAPVLAIVAALEGFAAPVLASTGSNRPVALFGYLLVLDVGIFLVAWFKAWRVLNLIGLVGTFALAAGWAQRYYTPDQYGTVQPFLIAFFVLFTLIGLLFARRTLFDAPSDDTLPLPARAADTLRRVGRVDSSLVFGVPMVAFAIQYLLMRPWEFGAAFSALALGLVYLGLGRMVFATQPRGLALLAEAYAIVGIIFGTLAIPLGLEGQWTGATWAVEAAGMYWLGIRQQRPYARAFALVLVLGAVVQLLRAITLNDSGTGPLLHGSVIGPLMLAAGVFAVWALQRRHRLDAGKGWEALAGAPLPWIAMGTLTLLPWQLLTPMWAATFTALMALVTWIVATRASLAPLKAVVHAMQLSAVVGFVATLHRGAVDGVGDGGGAALASDSSHGGLAAALLALSVLATAALAMRASHRAALAAGVAPAWSLAQIAGPVGGVALLHLAMLLGVDLSHAALIWPFTAALVLWVALRIAHPALAILASLLHVLAAGLLASTWVEGFEPARAAFSNLPFWTVLALAVTALVAADWLRNEAAHWRTLVLRTPEFDLGTARRSHVTRPSTEGPIRRWVNAWCAHPLAQWGALGCGLSWWLVAMLGEGSRTLQLRALSSHEPALIVGVTLVTSALASAVATRRDWRQLGQATLLTLPGFALAALVGIAMGVAGEAPLAYLPSMALGWLAWPLALAWHLRLLHGQRRWFTTELLTWSHVAGLWFFMLLAARECQWQSARFGGEFASWPLLGWALVPVLVLWALRSPALLQRWPLRDYRTAYLEIALLPVAGYLFVWIGVTNVLCAGDAAPLPYVPLLNPLELAHALVLLALVLWWKALPDTAAWRPTPRLAMGIAAVSGWALLTGIVLRTCHHHAGVPWEADALYGSRLTQAALSITWALCGVLAMVLGHRRRSRLVWIGGAALLGVVVAKLFLVELADQGGLFRIVSFVGVGVLMLVVGYFAPVPPAETAVLQEQPA